MIPQENAVVLSAAMHRLRIVLAAAALILLAAGTFQSYWWTMFTADRAALGSWLTDLPYGRTPGLREFMLDVRERTPKGARIAVLTPYTEYQHGYVYVFSRATYLLAGRTTLPLIDEHDRTLPHNLADADYIAAFRANAKIEGFTPIWSSPSGVLLWRPR
ncbi:MAG: hypothetical protein QOH21_1809 [Acidobacteriota bacterium]|nr:hypothetical protein [Acidobacteriota bacterium]